MNGKYKCETLKAVRKIVAEANGIDLKIRDCNFTGDCPGTCPACENELQTLTAALAERHRSGKRIAVTALAAGLITVSAGCSGPFLPHPDPEPVGIVPRQSVSETEPDRPPFFDPHAVLTGKIAPETSPTEAIEPPERTLTGDIADPNQIPHPETTFTLSGLVPNPGVTEPADASGVRDGEHGAD